MTMPPLPQMPKAISENPNTPIYVVGASYALMVGVRKIGGVEIPFEAACPIVVGVGVIARKAYEHHMAGRLCDRCKREIGVENAER